MYVCIFIYVFKSFWDVVVFVVGIKCINSGLGFLNSTQFNSTCVTCTRKHVKSFALIDMRYIWCDVIVSDGDCVADEDDVVDVVVAVDDDFVVPFFMFSLSHSCFSFILCLIFSMYFNADIFIHILYVDTYSYI